MTNIIEQFTNSLDFELDEFQIKAFNSLLDGKSVLVTAPTGSGKTLVAEFAAHDAVDRGLKIFYTTPLKALSNQKYHDFCKVYDKDEVGLLTGDVSINPEASIIVMTTEILRNILYQNVRRLDSALYIVLDECHYMNDKERGTVWEEIIIHCPKHILLVALSATVKNSREISTWISSIHNKVDVIDHDVRSVPINFLYSHEEKLFSLLDENGNGHQNLLDKPFRKISFRKREQLRKRELNPVRLIRKMHDREYLPVIFFIFSRMGCDKSLEECLYKNLNLVSKKEANLITEEINRFIEKYPSISQSGKSTRNVLKALKYGLAAHHAGLIPVIRSLIEDLFQKNLVKVVFATETLAAGINMPARTTVINSLMKKTDDGVKVITPNSFMQMVGRAGRRGKDDVGYCIVVDDKKIPYKTVVDLVKSEPDPIVSNFSLSYNMVLNLIKNFEWEKIETILKKSFGQYLNNNEVIDLRFELEKRKEKQEKYSVSCEYKPEIPISEMPLLEYKEYSRQIDIVKQDIRDKQVLAENKHYQRMFNKLMDTNDGSVVAFLTKESEIPLLGVVLCKYKQKTQQGQTTVYAVVISNKGITRITPEMTLYVFKKDKNVKVPDRLLAKAYTCKPGKFIRDKDLVKPFKQKDNKTFLQKIPKSAIEYSIGDKIEEIDDLKNKLFNHECHKCDILDKHLESYKELEKLDKQIQEIRDYIDFQAENYINEFKKFLNVLMHYRQIQQERENEYFLSEQGLISSYIRAENDLLISFAIEKGVFDDLTSIEAAAMLSILVYEPRRNNPQRIINVPEHFDKPIDIVFDLAEDLEYIQSLDNIDRTISIDIGFIEPVLMWGNGISWKNLLRSFELDEGDIIRSLRRLIDLLHQLKNIPSLNGTLKDKFSEAIKMIDKDIVVVFPLDDEPEILSKENNESEDKKD